jgi:hypothetical protein
MVTYTQLRTRFVADTGLGGSGAAPALARALERIGWLAVREPTPDELASYLVDLLDDCVHSHRDILTLTRAIASVLRDAGPLLDGGLPPIEAYEPAAEDLLVRYVNDDGAELTPMHATFS